MKKEHEILFEPFKIGTVMIKNRFVLEPMEGTNMIDCLPIFKIGEDIYDYYVERAKNHVGLIIPGSNRKNIGITGERYIVVVEFDM